MSYLTNSLLNLDHLAELASSVKLYHHLVLLVHSGGEAHAVCVSVENGVEELHKCVAEDKHVFVVVLLDRERFKLGDAGVLSLVESVLHALNPMVGGYMVFSVVQDKHEVCLFEFVVRCAAEGT